MLEFLGERATFIQGATSIPDSRVKYCRKMLPYTTLHVSKENLLIPQRWTFPKDDHV